MDRCLSLLEKPQQKVIIEEKKLKYFISKVSFWDYFSITEQANKSSSVKEKTSLLNRYYKQLYQKFMCQAIFICLLFCVAVCCLQFSVWFWG